MKIRSSFFFALAAFACAANGYANVTDITWGYSGGVYCYTPLFDSAGNVSMYGFQSGDGTGQMAAAITTDTPEDPTLTIGTGLDNDTFFAWSGYHIDVFMDRSFQILATPTVSSPVGWSASYTPNSTFNGTLYVGSIDFSYLPGGIPVNVGDEFDFSYQVKFSGSTTYSLTENVSVTPVPEPGTLGLLAIGSLLFGGRAIARKRNNVH